MSFSKRKQKKAYKSFVMVGRGMLLRCQEWKDLSPAAKIIYLYIKAKYNGSNNGQIRLYYSELKGINGLSSPSTISKAFKELEAKGWIERTKIGGCYRYFNEYKLTGKFDECLH